MDKVSRSNAQHYTWGGVCDGWHLVRTPEVSVIEERMPPGTAEERHRHGRARQFFYVLSGTLTMELAGDVLALSAAEGIEVAPGLPHQARNDGDQDVVFLVVSVPPAQGDRFSEKFTWS